MIPMPQAVPCRHPAVALAACAGWTFLVMSGRTASADDVTISTYYPSPRGVYEELRSTGNAWLATQAGRVGIGTDAPTERLEVNGGLRLNPQPPQDELPVCTAERRGTLWFQPDAQMAGETADHLALCALVNGRYQWVIMLGVVP